MTKELSLICIFFVLFCLNIYSTWDNLSLVNPMLPFKQGLFFWECFVQGYIIITPAPVQAGRRENYASCGKLLSSEYNVDRHHKSYAHLLWAGIRHTRLRALASKIETDPVDDNSLTPPRCPEQPSAPAPVGLLAVPENVRLRLRGTARIGQNCPVFHPGDPCSLSPQLQMPLGMNSIILLCLLTGSAPTQRMNSPAMSAPLLKRALPRHITYKFYYTCKTSFATCRTTSSSTMLPKEYGRITG